MYVQDQVCRIQPESIPELQREVEEVAVTVLTEMLRDAAKNVRKRALACLEASRLWTPEDSGLQRPFLALCQVTL